jgi:hypothetical protein
MLKASFCRFSEFHIFCYPPLFSSWRINSASSVKVQVQLRISVGFLEIIIESSKTETGKFGIVSVSFLSAFCQQFFAFFHQLTVKLSSIPLAS